MNFFSYISSMFKKDEEHNDMAYYYDDINGCTDNEFVYKEPEISYENDTFDGGKMKVEKNYEIYKPEDIFGEPETPEKVVKNSKNSFWRIFFSSK